MLQQLSLCLFGLFTLHLLILDQTPSELHNANSYLALQFADRKSSVEWVSLVSGEFEFRTTHTCDGVPMVHIWLWFVLQCKPVFVLPIHHSSAIAHVLPTRSVTPNWLLILIETNLVSSSSLESLDTSHVSLSVFFAIFGLLKTWCRVIHTFDLLHLILKRLNVIFLNSVNYLHIDTGRVMSCIDYLLDSWHFKLIFLLYLGYISSRLNPGAQLFFL